MPSRASRILYVESNTDGTVGGSHRALWDLVRLLDRERYEPVVLFLQDNPYVPRLRELGVQVELWVPPAPAQGLVGRVLAWVRRVRQCAAFLRREDIALVHTNGSPTLDFEFWLPVAHRAGIPCVAHARGEESSPVGRLGRLLMRRFDRVIAVSGYMGRAIVEAGVPASTVDVIHDGIEAADLVARVTREPGEERAKLGLSEGVLLAVMVGHLRSWKGQDVVLEALGRLDPALRSRLHVAFVGGRPAEDSAYQQSLEETASDPVLEACTSFVGEQSDAANLMNAADLVIHASSRPEPFGLVVLEGMVLSKAVIASDLGGPVEILTPESGLRFDPRRPEELATALARLLSNDELRRSLGRSAALRAAEFSLTRTVGRVESVYADLLAARGVAA